MRHFFAHAVSVVAVVVLALGCGKKKREMTETEPGVAESATSTGPENRAAGQGTSGEATVASGENSSDAAIPGVPQELADSSRSYEAWFARHGLNLNDPQMLDADPDADGANNRDEFMADTNPRDPNSRPGVHPFMRLKEFHEVKIPLLLESVEGETARIKHVDSPDGKTETVRAGQ